MGLLKYDWEESILNRLFDPYEKWIKVLNKKEKKFYSFLEEVLVIGLIAGIIVVIFFFKTQKISSWMWAILFTNLSIGIIKQKYRKHLKCKYKLT